MFWRSPWLQRRILLMALAGFDIGAIAISYNLAYHLRFQAWPGISNSVVALTMLWLAASYLLGRYSRTSRADASWRPLMSTAIAGVVVATGTGVLAWGAEIEDPRALPGFAIPVACLTAMSSTLAQALLLRTRGASKRWVLVGHGDELGVISDELDQHPLQETVAIHLTESCKAEAALSNDQQAGIAIGERADLSEEMLEKVLALRAQGRPVVSLINWSEQVLQRVPPELFSNTWLAHAEGFDLQPDRLSWRLKRMGDLVMAILLLTLTSPILLLAALFIKLEDGGPILFSQIRTGIYGQPMRIFKLRSMGIDAETQGAQWAQRGDPRVTRIGSWLRRLRVDELPQLINVIRGDMSLIGPRPERPEFEEELERRIPHYRLRHWVRPGLSGWAQVCHPYGASVADSRAKLSYDIYYIRNFSWALDFLILLKTIRLISRGAGSEPT